MELFRKIKQAMGLETQKVFHRWTTSELEKKRLYLEKKSTEGFTTEDHYLAAEWVIQRYLPEGEEPTPQEWSKTITNLRQNIDFNIRKTTTGETVKYKNVHTEPYTITKEDFLKDIVPVFSNFEFLPDPYFKDSHEKELWAVLFEFTQPYSYKHGEARDALISLCDAELAGKLVQDLARTYSTLRRAKAEGSLKVKLVCSGKQCADCVAMNGRKIEIEELLNLFKSGRPSFPHPLKIDEEASYCPAPYLSPETGLREGDDHDFHAWLVKNFEGNNEKKD